MKKTVPDNPNKRGLKITVFASPKAEEALAKEAAKKNIHTTNSTMAYLLMLEALEGRGYKF